MDMLEASFDHSTFSKNRQRLLRHRVSREFFDAVVSQADRLHLLSDEHFSVDGTLIEAAASLKSFRPKDEPPPPKRPDGGSPNNRWVDFHDQKRSNATHQSTTDPDARLYRKGPGKEARLSYMGQALMEIGMVCWWTSRSPARLARLSGTWCRTCSTTRVRADFIPRRLVRTKAMTHATVCRDCDRRVSRPTSRRTPRVAVARWMDAQPTRLATPPARKCADESKKSSAG
jgi:hypothetical protein